METERVAWHAGRSSDLAWARFGDEFVIYHRPSGKTHFLNDASVLLLTRVLIEPTTAQAAAERLAEIEGAVGDHEFSETVARWLAHLEHLGLIERVSV